MYILRNYKLYKHQSRFIVFLVQAGPGGVVWEWGLLLVAFRAKELCRHNSCQEHAQFMQSIMSPPHLSHTQKDPQQQQLPEGSH